MLSPGQLVAGKYRVERLLGEGGMGAVYVAVNERLQKRVALKVLGPNTVGVVEAVARFAQESIAASRVKHPGVVEIFDADVHEGMPWIAMELLEGQSLGERIARGPLPVPEALAIASQALSAIAAVHAAGIIHRDLKPDNLFIESLPGGQQRVKVLDFGIAKVSRGEVSGLTGTGVSIGTPHYLAPEQASDAARVDARADVYAMGAILFEALSGAVPYEADSFGELVMKMYTRGPRSVLDLAPRVPAPVAALVDRCLSVDPAGRPPSAADLLREIDALRNSLQDSLRAGAPTGVASGPSSRIPVTQEAPAQPIPATQVAMTAPAPVQAVPPVPAAPPVPAVPSVPGVPAVPVAQTAGPPARRAVGTPVLAEPVSVPRPSSVGWIASALLLLAVGAGVGGWALHRGAASEGPAGAPGAEVPSPVVPPPEIPEEVAVPVPPVADPEPAEGRAGSAAPDDLLGQMRAADRRRAEQIRVERRGKGRSGSHDPVSPAPTRRRPAPPESDPPPSAAGGGSIDPQELVRAFRAQRPALARCMSFAGDRDASSHDGRVIVRFVVGPEGDVVEATAQRNTTGSALIAECALAAVRRLRVARPPGASATTVSLPIVYRQEPILLPR